jgi:non-homologous end joining protein Ku
VRELVEAKLEGKEIVAASEEEVPVINLMDALRQSVARTKRSGGKAAPTKRAAASRKKPAPLRRKSS